jgi:hypothetical protein
MSLSVDDGVLGVEANRKKFVVMAFVADTAATDRNRLQLLE